MKSSRFLIVTGIFLALMTSPVYAAKNQQNCPPDSGRKGGWQDKMYKELNVTPEQQAQLTENRRAEQEKRKQLHSSIKDAMARLQKAVEDPAATRGSVEPIANELKSLQSQLIDVRVEGIFAVKQILTPEQFQKFNQKMAEFKDKKGRDWKKGDRQKKGSGSGCPWSR